MIDQLCLTGQCKCHGSVWHKLGGALGPPPQHGLNCCRLATWCIATKAATAGVAEVFNHISIDVMIGELSRVHSDALHLKQQVLLI